MGLHTTVKMNKLISKMFKIVNTTQIIEKIQMKKEKKEEKNNSMTPVWNEKIRSNTFFDSFFFYKKRSVAAIKVSTAFNIWTLILSPWLGIPYKIKWSKNKWSVPHVIMIFLWLKKV